MNIKIPHITESVSELKSLIRKSPPDNVVLVFLPPYSPELNPIERLWQDIKAKLFKNVFASIEEMQDKLTQILKDCTEPLSRV